MKRMKQPEDMTNSRLKPVITSNRYAYFRTINYNVNLKLKSKVESYMKSTNKHDNIDLKLWMVKLLTDNSVKLNCDGG